MKTFTAAASLAGLVSTVAGHGFITSPKPRSAGDAMSKACGQQMYNMQSSDTYGNIQGELQVANNQKDYDAAACDVWLCKGFKFDDNKANVQSYTAGQKVAIAVDIRAPHTGTANVSVVKTSSNSVIGEPLISWDSYASNAAPIPDSQKNFEITIPSNLGSQCATAGDCVIQWSWDARSIDQTYQSCIDFTVDDSGSGSGTGNTPTPASSITPVASSAAPVASSSAASSAPLVSASATPVDASGATSSTIASAPAATATQGSDSEKTYTLETFISWLEENGASSAARKLRREMLSERVHARSF